MVDCSGRMLSAVSDVLDLSCYWCLHHSLGDVGMELSGGFRVGFPNQRVISTGQIPGENEGKRIIRRLTARGMLISL